MVRNHVALALLFVLASCDQAQRAVSSDDCLDLPVYPPPGVDDPGQTVIACVERTAAMYAKGQDTPAALADATIAKCEFVILREADRSAREAQQKPDYDQVMQAWRQHALPVIAEARARRCYS